MSVNLYDDAIVKNFRDLLGDSRISITPPDNVFRTIAKGNMDEIKFPLVTINRLGFSIIKENTSHYLKFEGATAIYNPEESVFYNVQALPIRINYSFDVWTKTRLENDNLIRELIFYFETHPTMQVDIPYKLDKEFNFNLLLDSDIEDNSDIIDHPNRGEYFRQTFTGYVDDAYLWKSSRHDLTMVRPEDVRISVKQETDVLYEIEEKGDIDNAENN